MSTDSAVIGYMPKVTIDAGNPEAEKYGKLWQRDEYRAVAPGENLARLFLDRARPRAGASVLDIGCGTGRGGLTLAVLGQLKVTMIDFVANCLDDKVRAAIAGQADKLAFIKADIEKPLPAAAQYGFCTDVMEHIPPDKVDSVLNNILRAAQYVFFSISNQDDVCGALIGAPLHLSVHPFAWWEAKFAERGCKIVFAQDMGGTSLFYLSGWIDGQEVVDAGTLNAEEQTILANVKYNSAADWRQVEPHESNDIEVMILGGGPSLAEYEAEIKQQRAGGVKLITLNGAYNWALAHGLVPSAQIIVDARPFNARFTKPVVGDCKYLIASQCDPSVLDGLPAERTYLWHTSAEFIQGALDQAYDRWWAIPGGSTVLLRAIPLMRMLGYRKFHLYGCDSCVIESRHHAFAQPENDSDYLLNVTVNPDGRIFKCHPWMASQATEFISLIRYLGDEIDLEVHGDGLLSHILTVGAALADLETEL